MKTTVFAMAALALTAPAFADDDAAPNDTISHMVANGALVLAQGQEYAITYDADGSFSDESGMVAGTWKASGNQHCLTIPGMVDNMCSDYPEGKTAGDAFDIQTEMGPMTVTLK